MLTAIVKRFGLWKFIWHMRLQEWAWKLRHGLASCLYKLSLWLRRLALRTDATVLPDGAGRERYPYRSASERYKWR